MVTLFLVNGQQESQSLKDEQWVFQPELEVTVADGSAGFCSRRGLRDTAKRNRAQHAEQQVMEWKGPEAVRTPIEVIQAAGDAEIIAVHFAPVPIAVLDAAKDLGDRPALWIPASGVSEARLEAAAGAQTVGFATLQPSDRANLLGSQRDDRIDAGGAACGQIACEYGDQ